MTSTVPPPARLDGPDKAAGRARYAGEHPLPGAAWAWPVTSTVPAGRVVAVDPAPALALPGVLAVLTADNVPRLDSAGEISPAHGAAVPDLMVLQDRRIAFRGQIVAAVVAETLEDAQEGAARVRVTEEPDAAPSLTFRADGPAAFVVDMTTDLSPGRVSRGDADTAFAVADVQVDETYGTAGQFAMPMEPHAAAATWEGDRLTIYCSDQGPSWTGTTLAGLLGVPVDDVEVVAEYVGGGFGSKAAPRPPIMLAALAARHVGRPVKVALDRPQSVDLTTYRSPTWQRLRIGASRDGDITALIHEATGQTPRLITYADQMVTPSRSLYDVPDCRTTTSAVPLDVSTPGWVRAPGEAPGMFALESAIDELAGHLGIDPVELRVRNEPTVDPATGHPFSSRQLVECLRTGAERFGWAQRTGPDRVRRSGRWLHGVGMASAIYPVMTFPATATATIGPSGPAVVEIGAADIGTGARTVLHQLAAEALGVSMGEVDLRIGRSSLPAAPFAGGSMGTGSWGWAIQGACEELGKAVAAAGGVVPQEGLSAHFDTTEAIGAMGAYSRHSYGAHFAEVRVDQDTGEVRVHRVVGVFGAGRIINPATARSQIIGGMIMGLGMALMEAAEADHHFGGWTTRDLAAYHVPAHADIGEFEVVFLPERDDQIGPVAGKGVGEIGIVGVTAAITNAIHHATGIRVRTLPATPDKLLPGLLSPARPQQ